MRFPFWRQRRHQELDEEMRSHLQMAIHDRIERGESDREAVGSALREMGNVGLIKEVTKEMWGWASLERLAQDLRYGLRVLRKSPGFTFVAVLSLALGIGANTAIFSLVDKVLLRTLPVERPDRLVLLGLAGKNGTINDLNYPDYAAYRDRNQVFDGLICFAKVPLNLTQGDQTERVQGLLVSGNYFDVLQVRPAVGRSFLPEEDKTRDTHPVAVISYGLWKSKFGGDPKIVSKNISLNGYSFTVVGITPSEFTGTYQGFAADVYVPMMMQSEVQRGRTGNPFDPRSGRQSWWINVMGRLKPGISRAQAENAMGVTASQVAGESDTSNGTPNQSPKIVLDDGSQGFTNEMRDLKFPLKLLMAIVALVLLIACANVANLLLARAGARHKEIAIRLAIGSGRARLIRQLLTESLLLATLGGAAGLVFTVIIGRFLVGFAPPTISASTLFSTNLDVRVLGFALLLSLATGIVFGLAPAFVASNPDLIPALKDEMLFAGRGPRWLTVRNLIVVVQIALSLIVLIGAGLCIRSLRNLQSINAGFETTNILTMSMDMSLNGYDENRAQQFIPLAIDRISSLPGIESASVMTATPLTGIEHGWSTWPEGYQPQPGERPLGFSYAVIGPDYFKTMKTPLIAGREFTAGDTANSSRVTVINETLARKYFGDQNPIGKHLFHGRVVGNYPADEIVGVVKDSKFKNLTAELRPTFYCPLSQNYERGLTLFIRTASAPTSVAVTVRQAIRSLDSNLPLYGVRTLEEVKSNSLYTSRFAATLLAVFGLLALLLAAVGIYGVMSYAVNRRTREIGIRMALGAQKSDVFRMVIGQGMILVIIGLILGTAGAIAGSRYVEGFLYGVSATDKWTYIVIAVVMAAVALLANYVPARRALKVDPMTALRYE